MERKQIKDTVYSVIQQVLGIDFGEISEEKFFTEIFSGGGRLSVAVKMQGVAVYHGLHPESELHWCVVWISLWHLYLGTAT